MCVFDWEQKLFKGLFESFTMQLKLKGTDPIVMHVESKAVFESLNPTLEVHHFELWFQWLVTTGKITAR